MSVAHITINSKGGVGKSFLSPLIAEYITWDNNGVKPLCFDIDVSNKTFSDYSEFNVEFINLMVDEGQADLRVVSQQKFDVLMNKIVSSDVDVVVDTGSNSFHPLLAYLLANDTLAQLKAAKCTVKFHVPLTAAVSETVAGLVEICRNFTTFIDESDPTTTASSAVPSKSAEEFVEAEIVVWLNRYWGPIEEMGVPVESLPAYKALTDGGHIQAVVDIPKFEATTSEAAIKDLIARRRTFTAAINDTATQWAERGRYIQVQKLLFNKMKLAGI